MGTVAGAYGSFDRMHYRAAGIEPGGNRTMFIWDFVAESVMGQVLDWIYSQLVGFLGDFFAQMGNMGAELFEMEWVQGIVLFFTYLAWALYMTGLLVAVFECAIEAQHGRGSIQDTALNAIKGFMAVSLFSVIPVELYKLSVSLQATFAKGFTSKGLKEVAVEIIEKMQSAQTWQDALAASIFGGTKTVTSLLYMLFLIILMGYAVIKVFFANLKRGGILLIQIAVGSLYMFSIPRGYTDGFTGWCKQVIGLCLTAFLQATILTAGLMMVSDHALMGMGLMLSAGEVPRIAGQFGLETGTRANVTGAVYAAQGAMNLTRTVAAVVK